MKFSTVVCYLCILVLYNTILSSGHVGGYRSPNRVRSIADVFRGYNNRPIVRDPLFDVHCYDVTGIKTLYDDCWNSPRTTEIVLRNRDVSSRINSRRFSVYDTLGGGDLITGYPDAYDSDLLVSPTGFGLNCIDVRGVKIQSDDCWTNPRIKQLLLTSRGDDMRINTRSFGAKSTYYGASSLVSTVEEVDDCYCVTQDRYDHVSDILVVKLNPAYSLTSSLRRRLLGMNWNDFDGCVPYDVIEVPHLPYMIGDFGNSVLY